MNEAVADEPGADPRRRARTVWVGLWLLVLWTPLHTAWRQLPGVRPYLGVAVVLAFLPLYMVATMRAVQVRRSGSRPSSLRGAAGFLVAILIVAVAMTGLIGPDALVAFTFVAVYATLALPLATAGPVVGAIALGVLVTRWWPGWPGQNGVIVSVILAGVATHALGQSRMRSAQLAVVRQENLRLAVLDERNRMARDMHDILGHSLTVIRAKAELAERLLDVDPERSRAELKDLERLSRESLTDVRRAVSGYRELSLAGEIARARMALQAAGIRAQLPGRAEHVDPDLRLLFAWTLREAVTNVIRHADASRVWVDLSADTLEIRDDGRGAPGLMGTGLSGIRERAADAGARLVTADAQPGFIVIVTRSPGAVHA